MAVVGGFDRLDATIGSFGCNLFMHLHYAFPEAVVQTCIVHLLRNPMSFVSWKARKPLAKALRAICRAADAKAAEEGAIAQSWRRAWAEVVPFFAFPNEVRRIIHTTNAIEPLNSKLR